MSMVTRFLALDRGELGSTGALDEWPDLCAAYATILALPFMYTNGLRSVAVSQASPLFSGISEHRVSALAPTRYPPRVPPHPCRVSASDSDSLHALFATLSGESCRRVDEPPAEIRRQAQTERRLPAARHTHEDNNHGRGGQYHVSGTRSAPPTGKRSRTSVPHDGP